MREKKFGKFEGGFYLQVGGRTLQFTTSYVVFAVTKKFTRSARRFTLFGYGFLGFGKYSPPNQPDGTTLYWNPDTNEAFYVLPSGIRIDNWTENLPDFKIYVPE
jgi:hypothetical protein